MRTSKHSMSQRAAGTGRLVLRNSSQQETRARLFCGELILWDVWLAPGGRVTAPSFPPERLVLQARLELVQDQVCFDLDSPVWAGQTDASLSWRLDAGLGRPLWERAAKETSASLRVHNRTAERMALAVHFLNSPYRMAIPIKGHSHWQLDLAQLSLIAIMDGVTSQCPLGTGSGDWTVQSGAIGPQWQASADVLP